MYQILSESAAGYTGGIGGVLFYDFIGGVWWQDICPLHYFVMNLGDKRYTF